MRFFRTLMLPLLLVLGGCGYNTLQRTDQDVQASWSEVVNQYQRRADLVPNLVKVVQAEANFERSTLQQVIDARARAGSIQATPALVDDPQAFQRFEQAQAQLGGALSRLLMVSENYPQLQANAAFRDLQAQIEGTENRIAVARNRYILAVRDYNVVVRSFPSNLTASAFGFHEKANFASQADAAVARAPAIDFGSLASAASGVSR